MADSHYSTPVATFTRTNDTNAYTAGDVLGAAVGSTAAMEFGGISYPMAARPVAIRAAELRIDAAAVPSGMTFFTLHLYSVTPPSALGDNAAFDLPSGDRASYLGSVVVGSPVDLGNTLYCRADNLNVDITLSSDSLYAYLVTAGAWTPAAQTVFTVALRLMAM